MTALLAYLGRCGVEFDVAVNVLLGGALGETVSRRCATAWRAGKRWGCLACRFLDWAVQRGHCAAQFDASSAPWFTYLRAGIAFGVAFAGGGGMAHALWTFL